RRPFTIGDEREGGFVGAAVRLRRRLGRPSACGRRTTSIVVLAAAVAARYPQGTAVLIGDDDGVHPIQLARAADVLDGTPGARAAVRHARDHSAPSRRAHGLNGVYTGTAVGLPRSTRTRRRRTRVRRPR